MKIKIVSRGPGRLAGRWQLLAGDTPTSIRNTMATLTIHHATALTVAYISLEIKLHRRKSSASAYVRFMRNPFNLYSRWYLPWLRLEPYDYSFAWWHFMITIKAPFLRYGPHILRNWLDGHYNGWALYLYKWPVIRVTHDDFPYSPGTPGSRPRSLGIRIYPKYHEIQIGRWQINWL